MQHKTWAMVLPWARAVHSESDGKILSAFSREDKRREDCHEESSGWFTGISTRRIQRSRGTGPGGHAGRKGARAAVPGDDQEWCAPGHKRIVAGAVELQTGAGPLVGRPG